MPGLLGLQFSGGAHMVTWITLVASWTVGRKRIVSGCI